MNTLGVSPHSRGNRRQKPRYDLKNVHYNLEFSKFKLINFAWLDPRSTNQLSNSGGIALPGQVDRRRVLCARAKYGLRDRRNLT